MDDPKTTVGMEPNSPPLNLPPSYEEAINELPHRQYAFATEVRPATTLNPVNSEYSNTSSNMIVPMPMTKPMPTPMSMSMPMPMPMSTPVPMPMPTQMSMQPPISQHNDPCSYPRMVGSVNPPEEANRYVANNPTCTGSNCGTSDTVVTNGQTVLLCEVTGDERKTSRSCIAKCVAAIIIVLVIIAVLRLRITHRQRHY